MEIPSPAALLDRVRSLPAGAPLLERLEGQSDVHLVGGAVRDLLLSGGPTDLDLVVEGDAARLVAVLGGRVTRHERFGTWTVALGGFAYDIARTRSETYPAPGALPEVRPGTLEEDLKRRDFTVNAIALALGGPRAGMIAAPGDALQDLEHGRLRVLHPRSFIDDPTRLLRLARYRSRLGFEMEPATAGLAAAAVAEQALETVSGPRIGSELRLLSCEADPVGALSALHDVGLEPAIHPRFGLGYGEFPANLNLGRRALALLPVDARADRLALAVAARAVPRQELWMLLDRLAFEAEDREAIVATAADAGEAFRLLGQATRPSQIAAVARDMPLELVAMAGALGPANAARAWLDELRHVRLEIDGGDLLRAGVPEGPAIGRGLRASLSAKLDGLAGDREAELAAALAEAKATGSLPG
jgi:tRNA nucleotidyltransferase (CCA-adding enzyme)